MNEMKKIIMVFVRGETLETLTARPKVRISRKSRPRERRRLLCPLRKNDDFISYLDAVARLFFCLHREIFAWPLCMDDTHAHIEFRRGAAWPLRIDDTYNLRNVVTVLKSICMVPVRKVDTHNSKKCSQWLKDLHGPCARFFLDTVKIAWLGCKDDTHNSWIFRGTIQNRLTWHPAQG